MRGKTHAKAATAAGWKSGVGGKECLGRLAVGSGSTPQWTKVAEGGALIALGGCGIQTGRLEGLEGGR